MASLSNKARLATLKCSFRAQRRYIQIDNRFFKVSKEVRNAVTAKKPVVALETTIYTHGFPYPDNIQLAARLEMLVRCNGGIPAHCCILDGVARVGLNSSEMQKLLECPNPRKVSRRDLGYIGGLGLTSTKVSGGTTISGTMILAHLAGIRVFATGGLGGVHRGVESTMDVSADLTELGRTPVAVISAGCKGFLDIPRTLEYLETAGVLVGTFADGRDGPVKFPAFWSRESNTPSPFTIKNEQDAAAMIFAQFSLPLTSGMLLANPVPEEHSINPPEMSRIIEDALQLADDSGVTGAANTPFVLNAIKELSGGQSIPANRALIEANVIRGTRVAVELAKLDRESDLEAKLVGSSVPPNVGSETSLQGSILSDNKRSDADRLRGAMVQGDTDNSTPVDVVVVGSIAIDLTCDFKPTAPIMSQKSCRPVFETSNPAQIMQSVGGVGYNVAKAMHLAGGSVTLCSRVGNDLAGKTIRNALELERTRNRLSVSTTSQSAQYVAINDTDKSLVLGMADMNIFTEVSKEAEDDMLGIVRELNPKWVVIDANWSSDFLLRILEDVKSRGVLTVFEPVSTAKATRLFSSLNGPLSTFPTASIDLATPNKLELMAIFDAAKEADLFEQRTWWKIVDNLGISSAGARVEFAMAATSALVDEGIPQRCVQLLPFIPCIITKLGEEGLLVTQLLGADDPRLHSPDAAPYIISRSKTQGEGVGGVYMRHFPPAEVVAPKDIVSVNGVGDTFLGVVMAALTKRDGINVEDCIDVAQRASLMTLKSSEAVSRDVERLRLPLEIL